MKVKPTKPTQGDTPDATELIPVLVEPLPGHPDEEVLSLLGKMGGIDVTHLAPGFISAELASRYLDSVRKIAYVHRKATKQLHRVSKPRRPRYIP